MPLRENSVGIEKAKAICRRCPVKAFCLREGIETTLGTVDGTVEYLKGIWGGTTEKERERIRALLGSKTLTEAREAFQSASGQT